ncbi:MAG: MFS transporter, partial [Nocardiopsaceae bacterium]|nr:MFS transporter [Nocardiopsaceae bacterium]
TAPAVPGLRRMRLFRFLAYALVLASSGTQFAVVPVVPDYAQRLGLSGLQQGLVLGATGLACLAVSVPAGGLSDRLGARKLTLWAGALMAVALLTQALAGSFLLLLAARLAFGTGYAVVWTAGLAWLERSAPGGLGLGGPVASAGIGSVAGPALSGFGVQYFGLASPFLAAAAVFALLTGALALLPMPAVAPAPSVRMRASLRAALSDRRTLAAAAAIMTAGGTTGVSALLAPRQLHAAGASPGRIGLAFAAAGVIFVVASALTASAGRRAIQTRVLMAGMFALAVAFSPAALSQAPVAILAMLCATTAARAVLWTVSYPLAAAGAERSGAGLGVVMGLLNGVWAATVLLGPLLAGAGAELAGAQVTFGLSAVVCLTVLAAAIPAAAPLRVPGWGARGTLLAPPQPPSPHSVRLSGRHEDHRH